jgi:hypothetical protein
MGSTWSVEALAEVAADGEVVWSWHPLLMSSWRRQVIPTGCDEPSIRSATVTKRNSSPGRARRKPLKPLRRKRRVFRGTCGDYRVHFCCTRAAGAEGTRRFLLPLLFRGTMFMQSSGTMRRGIAKLHLEPSIRGTSFERRRSAALRMRSETLMVRSRWLWARLLMRNCA